MNVSQTVSALIMSIVEIMSIEYTRCVMRYASPSLSLSFSLYVYWSSFFCASNCKKHKTFLQCVDMGLHTSTVGIKWKKNMKIMTTTTINSKWLHWARERERRGAHIKIFFIRESIDAKVEIHQTQYSPV